MNPMPKRGRNRRSGFWRGPPRGASQNIDPPQDQYYVTVEQFVMLY